FGSGSGSQRLKLALMVVLGVVTLGVGIVITGVADPGGSAKTWLIASLVLAWLAGLAALLTSGGESDKLHAATLAAEALARFDLTHPIPHG
ncbi:hypothetical protein, partial [Klebsiella pneumoniae]